MTLSDEAKLIRRSVAQLRPGRGRKYTPALRRRILGWVDRAKQTGMLECDCSNALGIPQHRFEVWREYAQRSQAMAPAPAPEPKPAEPMALVPVELAPDMSRGLQLGSYGLALVSPRGWRVEGLSVEQAFALLREFE